MLLAVLLIAAVAAAFAARKPFGAFRVEWRSFHPRREVPVPLPQPPLESLVVVTLPSLDGTLLHGWLLPSKNGAAVVFIHGSEADRRALLPEARLVARAGYGALLFDLPGHGESDGVVLCGDEARAAVRGAIRFLSRQPGVRPDRITAYGFSMGGYTLAQVAPDEPGLASLVLAGTPTDSDELTRWQHGPGRLAVGAGFLAQRLSGFVAGPSPIERMAALRRPVLVITGDQDTWVPPAMADRLARAAGGPSELLFVRGATHGAYLEADPAGYSRALLTFLGNGAGAGEPPRPVGGRWEH